MAAFVALGVYTGAFVAETLRAGILAVDRGQLEASRSLGLSYGQTMRYVVLPQAIAITVPPLGNLAIALTKNTSLASSIAVADLLNVANLVNSRTFATYEVFGFVALCYLRRDPPHGRRRGAPGAPPDPLPLAHVLGEGKGHRMGWGHRKRAWIS